MVLSAIQGVSTMRKFMVVPVLAVCLALGLGACAGGSSGSNSSFCKQLKDYRDNQESLLSSATDSENYEKAVTELRKLEKIAPKAIKPDVEVVREAAEKLQAGDLNSLTDPEFSNKVQTAAGNLEQYSTKVCKIEVPRGDQGNQGDQGGR
jgi:hypothetical protein